MARPIKNIKWEIVLKRMQAGNTAENIYSELELAPNTFYNRFKEEFGCSFCDYCDGKSHETGKANILFTQYMKALSGNTHMLMLLGKEWCGQGKEVVAQSPYQAAINYEHKIMELENKINQLEANANKSQTE